MPDIPAADIEQAIEHPAAGQAHLFLDFDWLVPHQDGHWWNPSGNPKFPVHYLFTQPERMGPLQEENERGRLFANNAYPLITEDGWNIPRPRPYQPELDHLDLIPMPGRDIFAALAATESCCEVQINPLSGTYERPHRWGSFRMASGIIKDLARGVDPRPSTRILPARSIAEIHLFMRYLHSTTDLEHRLEYIDGELVAVYEGRDIHQNLSRQAFTLVSALEDPWDLGPGASAILCGPTLAGALDFQFAACQDPRDLDSQQWLRDQAPAMLRQLDELLKMVDPATGEIASQYFRHPHSVSLIQVRPQLLTAVWLEEKRSYLQSLLLNPREDADCNGSR